MKGIIYYTDNQIEEPLKSTVQGHILAARLPIVSVSLGPLNFGENIYLDLKRGYTTMIRQILIALENSDSDTVFFCEHDVLYHPSHFEFNPPENDTFYYNTNNWRWDYPHDRLFKYDGLVSLSQLCVNRELALDQYTRRMKKIEELGPERFSTREPAKARAWGYEPGVKGTHNGGFSNDKGGRWQSAFPNVDIRHSGTFSPPKTKLENFKHPPTGWIETTLDSIEGWNLKKEFNL